MLKVALPRPSSDAVIRGDGRSASRLADDFDDEPPVRRLSRAEAEALRRREPALSPWHVVLAQVVVGVAVAALLRLVTGLDGVAVSALYGAAVVAVPGALMARGATSPLSTISPLTSTVSMLGWELVKIVVSVVMLAIAPRVVPGLSWPAMLATLALCMQTYWFALLWRGRTKN
ncbi:MAG: ATP synthase subunit I [Caldimonas sp.]